MGRSSITRGRPPRATAMAALSSHAHGGGVMAAPIRVGFVLHVDARRRRRSPRRRDDPPARVRASSPSSSASTSSARSGQRLQPRGVPVIAFGRRAGFDFSACRGAWRRRSAHAAVEVVHAHQYTPFFYGAIAARLSGARPRVIFTEHGRHYPDVVSARRRLANRLVFDRLADHVNAVCEFSARSLAEKDGFRPRPDRGHSRTASICPKYAPATDVAGAAAPLGLDPAREYVACVARFHPVKDHRTLLHAFAEVARRRPDVDLLLVGDGALRRRPRASVRANSGLSSRVQFLGVRGRRGRYSAGVDVFALTSVSEAASITLLEAMAAGLPGGRDRRRRQPGNRARRRGRPAGAARRSPRRSPRR